MALMCWFKDRGGMLFYYFHYIHSIINNRSEPISMHEFLKFQWYLLSHSSLNTPPRALALIPGGNTHGIVGPPCFASDARRANPWNLPLSFTEKIKMTFLYLWKKKSKYNMTTVQVAWKTKRTNTSLRRQWTVCDASSDFAVKRCLRNNHRNSILRVHILFWTKNLRTFQGLSRTHFPYFSRSPFNAKKNLEYYVFF